MRTFLALSIIAVLGYVGVASYRQYEKQQEWQTYRNIKYGYQLKYPPGWQAAAAGGNPDSSDTAYFFSVTGNDLLAQPAMPPRGTHFVSTSVAPNPNHLYVTDWYQKQVRYQLDNPPKGITLENDTLLSREVLRVTEYSAGRPVKSDFFVDLDGRILNICLKSSPFDKNPLPMNDFLGIVYTLSLENKKKN